MDTVLNSLFGMSAGLIVSVAVGLGYGVPLERIARSPFTYAAATIATVLGACLTDTRVYAEIEQLEKHHEKDSNLPSISSTSWF